MSNYLFENDDGSERRPTVAEAMSEGMLQWGGESAGALETLATAELVTRIEAPHKAKDRRAQRSDHRVAAACIGYAFLWAAVALVLAYVLT